MLNNVKKKIGVKYWLLFIEDKKWVFKIYYSLVLFFICVLLCYDVSGFIFIREIYFKFFYFNWD